VAHYALGNLRNKVLSSEYKLALPDEKKLAEEIARTRKSLGCVEPFIQFGKLTVIEVSPGSVISLCLARSSVGLRGLPSSKD